MGIGINFGEAYAKAQKGANKSMPRSGTVFVSVKDSDKKYLDELYPLIVNRGFMKEFGLNMLSLQINL